MEIQLAQVAQEDEAKQDEFQERTVRASFKNGTELREVHAYFYKDTGLGYTQTQSGNYRTLLESGFTLCPYVLPSRWQIEEACRRIAPHVKVRALNVYETYQQEHSGEKLGAFLKQVFFAVFDLGAPPEAMLPPLAEQLEALKDFVLERDASIEREPPHVL